MMILKQYIPLRWVAVEGNAIICSSYQWQSLQEINKDMYGYSNYSLHYNNLEILKIQLLIHNILFISLKCHHGFLQLRGIYPTSFQILGVSLQYYNTWCIWRTKQIYIGHILTNSTNEVYITPNSNLLPKHTKKKYRTNILLDLIIFPMVYFRHGLKTNLIISDFVDLLSLVCRFCSFQIGTIPLIS